MKRSCFCLWLVLAAASYASGEPELRDAEVRVGYSELKALLGQVAAAEEMKKQAPPVDAALLDSRLKLSLGDGPAMLAATFSVAAFGEGWRLVPLLEIDKTPASIEASDAEVVVKDKALCALVKAPGRYAIGIHFQLSAGAIESGCPFVKLKTQPGTSAVLEVNGVAANQRLRVLGLPDSRRPLERIEIPSGGASMELALDEMRTKTPPVWATTASVLVERDDVFLRFNARIVADAVEGSAEEMLLELPAGTRDLAVDGAGLSNCAVRRSAGGHDILHVTWADADARSRELHLRWRTPPMGDSEPWPTECPSPQGARSFEALAVAVRPDLTLLEPDPPTAAFGMAVPGWIREKLAAREYTVVRSGTPLMPRLQKTADVERVIIKSAKYTTTLVGDGAILTEGEFEIEHAAPARWKIRLPEGGRLLKCAIGDNLGPPIMAADGDLELMLPANARGGSSVRFSYTEKKDALDAVGGLLSVSLPSTPLFADRIEWQLTLPPGYEPVAVEGNLDVIKGGWPAIALGKRLSRGETPAVDIHYRKQGPRE